MRMITRYETSFANAIYDGTLRIINGLLSRDHILMLLTNEKPPRNCSLTNDTSLHVIVRIIGDVDESGMVGKAVN